MATRVATLVELGCEAVVTAVQELDPADSVTTGLHLSSGALRWLALARAELDIDQYVLELGEGEG
ncbi:hypothetical protein [Nocardioides cavernaquae]|uniref:hypothetical protein n=1 Tax=Nocardioides cavernaquae TaxID=2321396 RepID=UPI0011C39F4E|nr:hypothetical protein [Nocardioides cavernaquae]